MTLRCARRWPRQTPGGFAAEPLIDEDDASVAGAEAVVQEVVFLADRAQRVRHVAALRGGLAWKASGSPEMTITIRTLPGLPSGELD